MGRGPTSTLPRCLPVYLGFCSSSTFTISAHHSSVRVEVKLTTATQVMFAKMSLLGAFVGLLVPLAVLGGSTSAGYCSWNYRDIYTLPMGVPGGGETPIWTNWGSHRYPPACMASRGVRPTDAFDASVWVTGLTTYLNYDAIGGFGGIKLTYSDGSFWSLGDVTGNGGMVQSTQSVDLTNKLVTAGTVSYCSSPFGGTAPCGIWLQLVDTSGATSTAQLGKAAAEAAGSNTATMPSGAILAGAIGSWFNPGSTYCDTFGLMFFEDISSVTQQLLSWPELPSQQPGDPKAWSLLSIDGCSSAGGSTPTESTTFTWTSTKQYQFSTTIATSISEKVSVKVEGSIPLVAKSEVTAEMGYTLSDSVTTTTSFSESSSQQVTISVPGLTGYSRVGQFISFQGTLNTPVDVNYTMYFQSGAVVSWTQQESFSGVVGDQLFTTWQDTPCPSTSPPPSGTVANQGPLQTPSGAGVAHGAMLVPRGRSKIVLALPKPSR